MLSSDPMTSETAISRWLQHEMPRRGYPLGGPRAGGISRLAEDAGIPQASMSRIVNGRAEPSIESLRKLATLWKIPLGEMLVHAGYADLNDLHVVVAPADAAPDAPPVSLPAHVSLPDLEPWERHIWLSPHLTTPEKEVTILVIRLRRGELNDFEGIARLYYALDRVMERRMEPGDPLRAV
jgi:transcriptional regulator with XRE-family HTH domain